MTATSAPSSLRDPLFFAASQNWISRYANVTDVSLNIVPAGSIRIANASNETAVFVHGMWRRRGQVFEKLTDLLEDIIRARDSIERVFSSILATFFDRFFDRKISGDRARWTRFDFPYPLHGEGMKHG